MKIFITGSAGMVGKNFLEHPKSKEVVVVNPTREELNLLDAEAIKAFLQREKPDLILHCAGLVGGIHANMSNLSEFFIQNLDIGKNLVLEAKKAAIPKLINLGCSCFYPKESSSLLTEEMLLTGKLESTNEGYALAKISITKLCEYISKEDSFYQYKTIIPCNLYGRWDNFNPKNSHMIPSVIKKTYDAAHLDLQKKIEIWGDGKARRESLYAGDLADFIFYAIENFAKLPNIINVSSGIDFTITEYYQMAASIFGYKRGFIYNLDKPVGVAQKRMNISKLKSFGWTPPTSLKDGMKKTCDFYKEISEGKIAHSKTDLFRNSSLG